jgi:ATP-dependent DNA ligase
MTRARTDVDRWFPSLGSALDGVIAKRVDLPYRPGDRTGMQKQADAHRRLRRRRLRYGTNTDVVGSLLLGLTTTTAAPSRRLHVQHSAQRSRACSPSGWKRSSSRRLHRPRPGGPQPLEHRRSGEWQPLQETRSSLEVRYDYFSAGRFRHGTGFLRWRPDKRRRSARSIRCDARRPKRWKC